MDHRIGFRQRIIRCHQSRISRLFGIVRDRALRRGFIRIQGAIDRMGGRSFSCSLSILCRLICLACSRVPPSRLPPWQL